jgi:protein involved in polysaccharide export with SLBB domain
MKIKYLFLLLFLLITVVCYGSTAKINPDDYIVKFGDVFHIQAVFDTLRVRTAVTPSGSLSLFPFADSVSVAGRTLTETHRLIESKIGDRATREHIMVQLGSISPIRYHVLGAVMNPGEYISEELITLQHALYLTGGLVAGASKQIRLLRNNRILDFDLNEYFTNKDLTENPLIMHDDVVMVNLAQRFVTVFTNNDTLNFVETIDMRDDKVNISDALNKLTMRHQWSNLNDFTVERNGEFLFVGRDFELEPFDKLYIQIEEMFVYLVGQVIHPGRIPFNGNISALYYISQGGGPNMNGSRKRVFIKTELGRRTRYVGQPIRPGDTVYVPESFRSKVVSFMAPTATIVTVISTLVIINNNVK